MADLVVNQKTTLAADEVIVRAIQFFSTENWRVTSQSGRAVTLAGKPPFPLLHLCFVIIGFMLCVVPGIILYFMLLRKVIRFQNMVVTATAVNNETDVSITYPPHGRKLVEKFLLALPRPQISIA
jgi:hypothetical protein